jgi:ribosome maturation factor RimP
LRIDVDRCGIPGVGISDCEEFSHALGERIEDLVFFDAPYELQVSSPGIDRAIRSDDDIRRNTGRAVWLEFKDEDGRIRELRGTLVGPDGETAVTIATVGDPIRLARDRIVHMKQDALLGGKRRKRP